MDCFSLEQVLSLLRAAKEHCEEDWLLILVTFLHALRASEAVGLTGDNVIGDYLVVRRGKKSRPVRRLLIEHENPLLDEKGAILNQVAIKGKSRLFPISRRTFQRRMHRYGKLAGLPELFSHPHTLKHSILTYLAETMTLPELQQVSGHKSLGSLGIYLHPKPEKVEAAFRAALGKAGT